MTKYKCGHKTNGVIILEDCVLSMSAYFEWANSVGISGDKSICWECWNKKHTKDMNKFLKRNSHKTKNNSGGENA